MEHDGGRRAQLAANLQQVRDRIALAESAAGRPAGSVTLTAVTKTYPASDAILLAGLGVTDAGENKDQEAAAKAAEVDAAGVRLRWHFVGQLQRNKVKSVLSYADVIESVGSERLAAALARGAEGRAVPLEALIQISIDGDPARGGVIENDLWRVSDTLTSSDGLRLAGVMAVAPLGWDPDRAFERLAVLAGRLAERYPGATTVSAGMSGDLEAAVRHGATHVRIGTSLLGMRNSLR
jgi:pyridoxal phosphate enzyme (YggS family)